ncbi:hypothetical protein EVA_15710, partial [gut metagenome]
KEFRIAQSMRFVGLECRDVDGLLNHKSKYLPTKGAASRVIPDIRSIIHLSE